jgi:hypothetical protein
MKKLLLLIPILLTSCVTTQQQLVQDALPAVPTAVSVAGTIALNLGVKDAAQRQSIANQMYAVAVAIRSLSSGAGPDPASFNAALKSFTGHDSQMDGVISAVGSLWSAYFPSVQGDPKLALDILEALAQGAEKTAENVLKLQQ